MNTTSILSYPNRGPWGDSRWPGNCSGFIYRDLFETLKPRSFIDPMMGSGTSIEVAKEMGVERVAGLDLSLGFDALTMSIAEAAGFQAESCFSHPPYGPAVLYSGAAWGDAPHANDLSHAADFADFNDKLQLVLLNQRDATLPGGFYGCIIGDYRSKGRYYSYQAELISRLPHAELKAVLIKAQHNTRSDQREYPGLRMPRIMHEYILIWSRPRSVQSALRLLSEMAREQHARVRSKWRNVVKASLMAMGGQATLADLYQHVSRSEPEQVASSQHYQAKIRQVLQLSKEFKAVSRGVWAIA